jgi:hypothetical protein
MVLVRTEYLKLILEFQGMKPCMKLNLEWAALDLSHPDIRVSRLEIKVATVLK